MVVCILCIKQEPNSKTPQGILEFGSCEYRHERLPAQKMITAYTTANWLL